MRVGVDGFNIAMSRGTGVASHGIELIATLRAMGMTPEGIFGISVPADETLREAVFHDRLQRPRDLARKSRPSHTLWHFARSLRAPRFRLVPQSTVVERPALAGGIPRFDRLLSAAHLFEDAYRHFRLTGRFLAVRIPDPPDIMHWTYPLPLAMEGARNVYTLHDLVPLKLPYTTLDRKTLYGKVTARCVATAAQVCTVSEASKEDIVSHFGIAPDRITNTYQTSAFPQLADADVDVDASSIEGLFGLERRGYFLYYGAIEPKKNVGRLIEAHLSLRTSTPLVIVGARAWQSEQELRLMPEGGVGGAPGIFRGHRGQTIVRLDYLPRELLAKLVRGARALVFPSLYEGFGLPVLEAMQLGTPVITSTSSSLPEIAGGAALLVDPYSVDALMAAMRRVDEDAALRDTMSERGREQAVRFSRPRYEERLAALYGAAIGGR